MLVRPALFLFAKAPIVGQVKTRLTPDYTPAQAAAIATVLIRETAALAVAHWPGPIYLAATPDTTHPLFVDLVREHSLTPTVQRGADLGRRMHAALVDGIRAHGAAAIIGCDVPHCRPQSLIRAYDWLAQGNNVYGPATDGGYYFVGLRQAPAELFTDIEWGGADVWQRTRERAAVLKLSYELLPTLRDIDTAADLRAAADIVPSLRVFTAAGDATSAAD